MLNNMYTNYNGLMNLGNMIANNKAVQVVYEEKAANVLNYENVVNLRKTNLVKVQKVEEPKEEVVEEVVVAEEPKEEVVEDNDNLVADIMNELKEEGVINEEGQLVNPKEEPKKVEAKKTIKDKAIDGAIIAADCMGKGCIEATKIVGAASVVGGVIGGLGGGILEAIKARKFQPIVNGLAAMTGTFIGTVQALAPIVAVGYGLKKLAKFIKKIANR